MNKSMVSGLCAAVALLVSGAASAAVQPHARPLIREVLPPLYVGASIAQAACPTDQVVWVNWSTRTSHLPNDKYYGHTKIGAYACARPSAEVGIVPAPIE
jgi:type IV secretory pathway VirB3-like protein